MAIRAATFGSVCASLLGLLAVLELGTRLAVDLEDLSPTKVSDVDPEQALSFVPGLTRSYRSSEFTFTVSYNRHGRRDVEWTSATLADPRNILMIGDSMVLGNAVDAQRTIPSQLEARLAEIGPPREVFNFGGPAGGPPQYEQLLRIAIDSGIGARVVVVGIFVGNDFYPAVLRPMPTVVHPPAAVPWNRSALLEVVRRRVAQSSRGVGWLLRFGTLTGIPVYDTGGSQIFLREPSPAQLELFDRILDHVGAMKDLCTGGGRELFAVLIPNRIQVENHRELTNDRFDPTAPNRRISEYCRRRSIACLDLLPALLEANARGAPLYFPIDRHLTPAGYKVAADAIFEFLGSVGALREPGGRRL